MITLCKQMILLALLGHTVEGEGTIAGETAWQWTDAASGKLLLNYSLSEMLIKVK